jgi:hypothetical protein
MNDLQTLHDAWGTPEPPTHTAYTDARAALLARAVTPRRRRRRAPIRLRVAAIATAGAMAAAFVLVVQNLGESPRAVPTAAAEVLERAAHAAETKPFTAPRPDQWVYTEDRITTSEGDEPMTRAIWHRVDSGGIAVVDANGKLQVDEFDDAERPPRGAPFDSYEQLAKLPTDPDALLRWAYAQAENVEGAGMTEDGDVYAIFNGVLAANVLPPDLEAGIFRALKRVPGVTVSAVDVFGERVISLAQTEGWLREELFLDPETYAYRGKRGTVVRDATISPEKAGNETGEIEKGHTATSVRIATAVVDEPGER